MIGDRRIIHPIHVDVVYTELSIGWRDPGKQAAVHWQFPNAPMRTTEIATLHNPIAFGYDINGL